MSFLEDITLFDELLERCFTAFTYCRRDRNHPWVKQLKTLKTERGTELIVSGWWGISRHINYFGDWLLACVSLRILSKLLSWEHEFYSNNYVIRLPS